MPLKLTYIHHSCFCLTSGKISLVFDYPAEKLLSDQAKEALFSKIKGQKVYLFVSHSHEDHFNPNLQEIKKAAKQCFFCLADDVQELYPDIIPSGAWILEPEQEYSLGLLKVITLPSNDQGLAFLINFQGLNIYFGGDLANWIWPSMTEKGKKITEKFFLDCLNSLADKHIHLAFSNLDKRLDNYAGARQAIQILKPDFFVPMHTFGNPSWIEDFIAEFPETEERTIKYSKTGDTIEINIPKKA